MIYDCFNFYNELELLTIRLHELDSFVDKFVLVESTVTFTNKAKKLFYEENKHLFKKFHHKIIHIIVKDSPQVYGNPWIIENFQLSAVMRGLAECKKEDIILLSCVDEIPKPERIALWMNKPGKHKVFLQQMSYYYLNYINYNTPLWEGTQMFRYKDLLTYMNPYVARFTAVDVKISDGGWHFTFMGGVDRIRTKLFSYSHQEFNNPKYNTPEKILAAVIQGKDLFHQGHKFRREELGFLPKYVQNNQEMFHKIILTSDKKHSVYSASLCAILNGIHIARKYINVFKDLMYKK
jgi:beta-1,4-mannosyl-glycoprotein beta-1,4-N-acetylglucosaminyltransferase